MPEKCRSTQPLSMIRHVSHTISNPKAMRKTARDEASAGEKSLLCQWLADPKLCIKAVNPVGETLGIIPCRTAADRKTGSGYQQPSGTPGFPAIPCREARKAAPAETKLVFAGSGAGRRRTPRAGSLRPSVDRCPGKLTFSSPPSLSPAVDYPAIEKPPRKPFRPGPAFANGLPSGCKTRTLHHSKTPTVQRLVTSSVSAVTALTQVPFLEPDRFALLI